jgi:hypothetical protein
MRVAIHLFPDSVKDISQYSSCPHELGNLMPALIPKFFSHRFLGLPVIL